MAKTELKSPHVADNAIEPFLQPDFDPADYLNSALPTASFASSVSKSSARSNAFTDLSTQLQTLLTQLNTNTTRLSNTLTQLTDEIIRSGSRLAYEVEVLRGETRSLGDSLSNELKAELDLLTVSTPTAAAAAAATLSDSNPAPASSEDEKAEAASGPLTSDAAVAAASNPPATSQAPPQDPEFLVRLRTLTTVRERLDAVIKVFGKAMAWPIAPSELSLTSSFISVSAPERDGSGASSEERGKAYAESLRQEVTELLASGPEGLDAASARVADLRMVAEVWQGTAEEKARLRLVDGLQKLVDDKAKALGKSSAGESRKQGTSTPARGVDYRYGGLDSSRLTSEGIGGYGFLQNLRNLKNDVYLD